ARRKGRAQPTPQASQSSSAVVSCSSPRKAAAFPCPDSDSRLCPPHKDRVPRCRPLSSRDWPPQLRYRHAIPRLRPPAVPATVSASCPHELATTMATRSLPTEDLAALEPPSSLPELLARPQPRPLPKGQVAAAGARLLLACSLAAAAFGPAFVPSSLRASAPLRPRGPRLLRMLL
ncbi:hypothetical protein ZWY2020_056518, partial [Hordeum vulgare]